MSENVVNGGGGVCGGESDNGKGATDACGKNRSQLVCVRCRSKILPPGTGTYVEIEFELTSFEKEKQGAKEKLNQFFKVEDMFQFDNIGFTNVVDNYKFLSCADCDLGPIGFHDLGTRVSYLAISRVQSQ
eukprot:TRINITY_DN754_c0_g1_i1.p1 TRINITY_DN754_c0_g1~~TRINITY_DN754_c0_g1_i1.p1  ORF type:complete len:130 (-),score=30.70 TRINITY_DN754_c0_g1_i1:138-527(-)